MTPDPTRRMTDADLLLVANWLIKETREATVAGRRTITITITAARRLADVVLDIIGTDTKEAA